ncbi:MAG: HAD-IA family hydrolase [Ruminiclostridium sp.]|nr:HAD-IA family hydrolase [Ruminiclostridium sp.]
MPKTIFFDLDGTLTDSGPGIMNCAARMLDHFKFPYDQALLRTFIGPPLRVRLGELGFTPEQAAEATKIFRSQYEVTGKFENSPYPGMIDLLKTLKAQGHRLFVATSKPETTAQEVLDHFHMTEYFEEICGADLERGRDTKDQVITYLKEKVGTLENVVMVGDTDYDVLGAKAHGIPTIGVTWGYGNADSMTSCGAIAIANTMAKLSGLLRE